MPALPRSIKARLPPIDLSVYTVRSTAADGLGRRALLVSDMFSIKLANGNRFDAPPDISILEAARTAGLVLEHSCRTGRCGLCRAHVLRGKTRILQPEVPTDELGPGEVLTCCRAAAGDLDLDVADLGPLAGLEKRILPCKITSISFPAPTIAHVVLRLPPAARFSYLAGQHIDIIAKGVRRSYSIANAPNAQCEVELYIRRFEGGILSRYWFEEAAAGHLLRFEGPLGTFFLRDEGLGPLVFLATGTGIAPVRAILEQVAKARSDRPVLTLWGNRTREDFFWSPDASTAIGRFVPVLSRADTAWKGARGYVQDVLIAIGEDLTNASVYACGSEEMVRSAEHRLTSAGLPKQRFFSDPFLSSD